MSEYGLPFLAQLMLRQVRAYRFRFGLAALAVAVSVCMLTWVVGGYDALHLAIGQFGKAYLGRYDFLVVPPTSQRLPQFAERSTPVLPERLRAALAADVGVAAIDSAYQTRARIAPQQPKAARPNRSGGSPMLVGTEAAEPPYPMSQGRWFQPGDRDAAVAVISGRTAADLQLELNDQVAVSRGRNESPAVLRIIGLMEQQPPLPPMQLRADMPSMRVEVLETGPADAALFVPRSLAEQLAGAPAENSYFGVQLAAGADPAEFRRRFSTEYAPLAPGARLQQTSDILGELSHSSTNSSVRAQAYVATGLALLVSLFVVFTTLSMGIDEKTRQFALLRAIALTKAQVVLLVATEAAALGLFGWGLGFSGGWAVAGAAQAWRPDWFPGGVLIGGRCLAFSAVSALGGCLLAAILPTCRALSLQPVEALSMRTPSAPVRLPKWLPLVAGSLVVGGPALVRSQADRCADGEFAPAIVGFLLLAVGFVLAAPTALFAGERLLSPFVARCLRLDPPLVALQLSTNLWRSLGVAISLTLGLGLFTAMQTWGYSMLGAFEPGDWMPDALVQRRGGAFDTTQIDAIRRLPGIAGHPCLPLAVEQPRFAEDITGAIERATVTRQDNCLFVGLDAELAFAGPDPLCVLRFVQGSRSEALAKLRRGRYCLVPDHFTRESGLGVGHQFSVVVPGQPHKVLQYEIAGVVRLDGWHWLTKFGMRARSPRSAAVVLAPFEVVRRDFEKPSVEFLWMNLDEGISDEGLRNSIETVLGSTGTTLESPKERRQPAPSAIQVTSAAGIRRMLREHGGHIIWGLSVLPLITLIPTSLGVASAILASVRARRWELAVLRAVGFTRLALVRLVLSEALLIALHAGLLSLAFGVLAGYCGTEITRYVNVHGGPVTPLTVPWSHLAPAFLGTLALCLAAAAGPAIAIAAVEPLELLQAGRAEG